MTLVAELQEWIEKQVSAEAIEAKQRGLVPESGNWEHPYRWIKPKGETNREEPKEGSIAELRQKLDVISNNNVALKLDIYNLEDRIERLTERKSRLIPGLVKKLKVLKDNYKKGEIEQKALEKKIEPYDIQWPMQRVLEKYAGDTYALNLNKALRKGKRQEDNRVSIIDEAISRFGDIAISPGQSLYRKISFPFKILNIKNVEEAMGIKFSDKAFVSTTSSKKALDAFDSGYTGESITPEVEGVIEIVDAPLDIKGLDMMPYSEYSSEMEVLLPRNLTFQIIEADETDADISWFKAKII